MKVGFKFTPPGKDWTLGITYTNTTFVPKFYKLETLDEDGNPELDITFSRPDIYTIGLLLFNIYIIL